MDQKEKIYTILKEAKSIVSGEKISTILGISRVSVWKHIKGMVQSDIPVISTSRGYRLEQDPDSMLPWEFGIWQDRIHHFRELPSTMEEAAALARQGCPDFTVVVAEKQTRGRGRMERVWSSDRGGLYFTVIVRPDIPAALASLVNLAAAVEMADLLRVSYNIQASLKWPNDILVNRAKICGILSQMETEGEDIANLRVGVGLNVNNSPEKREPGAVSLKTLAGQPHQRREILIAFLNKLKKRLKDFNPEALIADWKSNNITIGRQVTVATFKNTVTGKALDIDSYGGLILQKADGSKETVLHGDCFHG